MRDESVESQEAATHVLSCAQPLTYAQILGRLEISPIFGSDFGSCGGEAKVLPVQYRALGIDSTSAISLGAKLQYFVPFCFWCLFVYVLPPEGWQKKSPK